MKISDYYMQRMHYSHILKGACFVPEIELRCVACDKNNYYYCIDTHSESDERTEQFGMAILLKFASNGFSTICFWLIFFGVSFGIVGDDYETLSYGFIAGSGQFPITGTAGIRIGWLLWQFNPKNRFQLILKLIVSGLNKRF